MTNLRELNVFIEEDGQKEPFSLIITQPIKSSNAKDYFCNIHAPKLFKKDKSIHGVDAEQASELAIKFLRDMLSDKQLIDETGNPVSLE